MLELSSIKRMRGVFKRHKRSRRRARKTAINDDRTNKNHSVRPYNENKYTRKFTPEIPPKHPKHITNRKSFI